MVETTIRSYLNDYKEWIPCGPILSTTVSAPAVGKKKAGFTLTVGETPDGKLIIDKDHFEQFCKHFGLALKKK